MHLHFLPPPLGWTEDGGRGGGAHTHEAESLAIDGGDVEEQLRLEVLDDEEGLGGRAPPRGGGGGEGVTADGCGRPRGKPRRPGTASVGVCDQNTTGFVGRR